MSGVKLVIFDIAGTIIEDHGEVVSAFAAALEKNGMRVDTDELKAWKGASKREVIRHFAEQHGAKADLEERVEITYRVIPGGTGTGLLRAIDSDCRRGAGLCVVSRT